MILLDTSGLLAAIDSSQATHKRCAAVLSTNVGPFILSPFVLAELDYMLATRVGPRAQAALLEEVARSAYQLESFSAADVNHARAICAKYESLRLGLADASIVVLATRHKTRNVLTLDERHFRALRTSDGKRFKILPADGPR